MTDHSTETDRVAAVLHAEHAREFAWMNGTDISDPVPVSECGNCQRWARYAVTAGLRIPPGEPS